MADENIENITNNMEDHDIDNFLINFEKKSQKDKNGVEFWYGRDLQKLLSYDKWDNFKNVIIKAMNSYVILGQNVNTHWVPDVRKSISGKGKEENVDDFKLTRYACYLIAQNADSKKEPVAFAQTYFAVQTRRQEMQDENLTENERRIFLRNQIKEHNKTLGAVARSHGVISGLDFKTFHGVGYKGLYGGKTLEQIKKHKNLDKDKDLLDHISSTEMAANFFRITQTEEKLAKEVPTGKEKAFSIHYSVGKKIRETITELGGTMPEDLPSAEISVAELEKIEKNKQKILKKNKSDK